MQDSAWKPGAKSTVAVAIVKYMTNFFSCGGLQSTYISNIDENIIIEKRQLTFPILNLFFVHCSNDYTPLPLVAEHQDYSVHRNSHSRDFN